MNRLRGLGKSFFFAFRGIAYCIRHERNVRIHLVTAAYVFYFSSFYDFSVTDYAVLALVCGFVIVTEILNTSIEVVIDKVSPKYSVFAMIGKDLAAGAVLVSAVTAAAVGVIMFWNTERFYEIFRYFTADWLPPVLLLISVVISCMFIFSTKKRGSTHSQNNKLRSK